MEGRLIHIGDDGPLAEEDKLSFAIADANDTSASLLSSDFRRHETGVGNDGRRDNAGVGENPANGNGNGSSTSSAKRDRFKRHASMDEDRGTACGTDLKKAEEIGDGR